jgi:hypothetical protein
VSYLLYIDTVETIVLEIMEAYPARYTQERIANCVREMIEEELEYDVIESVVERLDSLAGDEAVEVDESVVVSTPILSDASPNNLAEDEEEEEDRDVDEEEEKQPTATATSIQPASEVDVMSTLLHTLLAQSDHDATVSQLTSLASEQYALHASLTVLGQYIADTSIALQIKSRLIIAAKCLDILLYRLILNTTIVATSPELALFKQLVTSIFTNVPISSFDILVRIKTKFGLLLDIKSTVETASVEKKAAIIAGNYYIYYHLYYYIYYYIYSYILLFLLLYAL